MAPTLRGALGVVKDQTSIGLAKVSSSLAPDLEVAVVKATSHVDEPAGERHVREILAFTSYSRAYVSACIDKVSRRLSRTRDWIVALKSLMLVHRLLSDGNPSFKLEILHATRRGTRLLNLSNFRDEAHSNSWDHSAFVRSYALYLDQRLECALHDTKLNYKPTHDRSVSSDYDHPRNSSPAARTFRTTRSFHDADDHRPPVDLQHSTPVRDLKPEILLSKMHHLQQLLDRFLACRPTARAKTSRLIFVALYPIVRESFKIYADLCELLAALLDRFFDMDYPDCVKAFEAYAAAAKQIDELVKFYAWCRETGVARSSEYPDVQPITDKLLDTLEEFIRDKSKELKSPKLAPETTLPPAEHPPAEDINAIKALPPPEGWEEPKPVEAPELEKKPPPPPPQETGDLVDLREDVTSADERGNGHALILWNAFPSDSSEVTSAWQTPAAEPGKADWEVALVESASNLSKQKPTLAGGFHPVLLDGMYDQGLVRQHANTQLTGGSASSVALPLPGLGRGSNPVLALPAPDGSTKVVGHDPFAASLTVPPPSYVQMADIESKQQLLVQEQMLWQHYSRDGMRGELSLSKLSNGYNNSYAMVPPVNGGGYSYHHHPVSYTGI